MSSVPAISVIIPVLNDAERLASCLESLERQIFDHEYEVLVIDNAPSSDLSVLIDRYPHARLFRQTKPGSYAARNVGIANARSSLFAFTDADCVPSDAWVATAYSLLTTTSDLTFFAGRIELFSKDWNSPTPSEAYESVFAFPQRQWVQVDGFAATANMATSKSVLDRVGVFDERLTSGGDREWGKRASGQGVRGIYAEELVVAHPCRSSLRELVIKAVRLERGQTEERLVKRMPLIATQDLRSIIRPPVRRWYRGAMSVDPSTARARMSVMAVAALINYVHAFERIRSAASVALRGKKHAAA